MAGRSESSPRCSRAPFFRCRGAVCVSSASEPVPPGLGEAEISDLRLLVRGQAPSQAGLVRVN